MISACPTKIMQIVSLGLAPVVELVDAADSKSAIGNDVGVQVPPGAPFSVWDGLPLSAIIRKNPMKQRRLYVLSFARDFLHPFQVRVSMRVFFGKSGHELCRYPR
jgi:hypothetical protein